MCFSAKYFPLELMPTVVNSVNAAFNVGSISDMLSFLIGCFALSSTEKKDHEG